MKSRQLLADIDDEWRELLTLNLDKILEDIDLRTCTPAPSLIMEFARVTPLDDIRVVIVGQDPYPEKGIANGLAFSSKSLNIPKSLARIYKCLISDGHLKEMPVTADLSKWSKQGVLLINRALTTEVGEIGTHTDIWEEYTRNILVQLSQRSKIIFMLWGNRAKELGEHLHKKSIIYEWTHPSPAAGASFVSCPHFSDANEHFAAVGQPIINWSPDEIDEVEEHFSIDNNTAIMATDGAYNKSTGKPKASWAAAFTHGPTAGHVIYGLLPYKDGIITNIRAEGIAILNGMRYIDSLPEVTALWIITDCDFWINMIKTYMPSWYKKSADPFEAFYEKKNPSITIPLYTLYLSMIKRGVTIKFQHVYSHNKPNKSGEIWSKFADDTWQRFCANWNAYVDGKCAEAIATIRIANAAHVYLEIDDEETDIDQSIFH